MTLLCGRQLTAAPESKVESLRNAIVELFDRHVTFPYAVVTAQGGQIDLQQHSDGRAGFTCAPHRTLLHIRTDSVLVQILQRCRSMIAGRLVVTKQTHGGFRISLDHAMALKPLDPQQEAASSSELTLSDTLV